MRKSRILLLSFLTILCIPLYAKSLRIESPQPEQLHAPFHLVYLNEAPYFSAEELARAYQVRTYSRKETGKIVLFFPIEKIKITASSTYIMVGTRVRHMPMKAVLISNQMYVPLYPFMEILKEEIYPELRFSILESGTEYVLRDSQFGPVRSRLPFQSIAGRELNIIGIDFEEKKNGLLVKLATSQPFKDSDFSTFFKGDDWFYLTINGGSGDSLLLSSYSPTRSLELVKAINSENAIQFSFRTLQNFKSSDVHYDLRSGQILLSLFLPLNRDLRSKIEEAKTAWILDTVVLDAGHGGNDSGTPGRWGLMHEKDIALDVTLRIGELLEQRGDIKVVYTRSSDVFIPLWRRTEIANKANGKLFLSIHVNGVDSPNAHGFEIYMLGQGRTEDAIRAAEKENAVVQMESVEDKRRYQGYDNIANILANMVHTVNMGDSENLAQIISGRVDSDLSQKNRGVKQAIYYVLIGADMPKLLIEMGFNSNRVEARKLNTRKYRQLIAETLYQSIIEFKEMSDRSVVRSY